MLYSSAESGVQFSSKVNATLSESTMLEVRALDFRPMQLGPFADCELLLALRIAVQIFYLDDKCQNVP